MYRYRNITITVYSEDAFCATDAIVLNWTYPKH